MPSFLHDTHAHLEMLCQKLEIIPKDRFDASDLALLDLKNAQILDFTNLYLKDHKWVIHPTVSNQNLNLVLKLFWQVSKVYFLLGSHPEIVDEKFNLEAYLQEQNDFIKVWTKTYTQLFKISQNIDLSLKQRLLGIGEIGLDYFYSQDSQILAKQAALFRSQIELAIRLDLPIQIHAREAWADIWSILKEYPPIHGKFLIHCFTGDISQLKSCLELGGKVAFGGIVTFPKSLDLQAAAVYCPSDSLILETDLPFLAPAPYRGKTCIPSMIAETAVCVAALRNTTPEVVWEWSRKNSKDLFGVD